MIHNHKHNHLFNNHFHHPDFYQDLHTQYQNILLHQHLLIHMLFYLLFHKQLQKQKKKRSKSGIEDLQATLDSMLVNYMKENSAAKSPNATANISNDADRMFCLSLVEPLKELLKKRNQYMKFKMRIISVLFTADISVFSIRKSHACCDCTP